MMRCPLCGTPGLTFEGVKFGMFWAHAGCVADFYRDYADDAERVEAVERDA